jgi:hypothetical protein
MKIQQIVLDTNKKYRSVITTDEFVAEKADLVLAFAQRTLLNEVKPYDSLKALYPNAQIVICSSSGQISDEMVIEQNIVCTAISFDKTTIKTIAIDFLLNDSIVDLGHKVKESLFSEDLKSIMVLSEGTLVNGTELINELIKQTQNDIPIFGGLAGDEFNFESTIVGLNSDATPGKIVAIGLYGQYIRFNYASEGGWGDFGPEREVTQSNKNVLYKIGDRFALDLYKEYLGKYADELPGSSLYFPLSMKETPQSAPVVRTILAIDEENKSMTFAGNIPEGSYVRLMKGNIDKLIDAASNAAYKIRKASPKQPSLAILVSCVGRRIVLDDRVEEELEVVKDIFGKDTILCGFYSYGEIAPTLQNIACELHNQTMTITTMYED